METQNDKPLQPQINLNDMREITCSCGCSVYKQGISMREIPSVITGTGKTEYVPMAQIVCDKCGKLFERPIIVAP